MSTHSPDNLEPDEPELGGGAGADARWWIVVGVSMALLAGLVGWKVGASSSAPSDDPVDVGFLRDMIDHHDQAVVMAVAALDQSSEPGIRGFGRDILIFQRYEIGRMEQQLSDIGVPRGDPRRQVMAWMGMGMPLAAMPGMASGDDLDALRSLEGAAFDKRFLELMIEHHRGAIHMADQAVAHAVDDDVVDLARLVKRDQESEIAEFLSFLKRYPG